ncbi:MAG TPA: hypothetical protein VFJ02_18035 [Vicinamibacterales bacterium]|nr:hypothetical protein [Vicinamibacterales bacterium]
MASHTCQSLTLCGVLVVFAVPGFAQTDTRLSRDRSPSAMAGVRVYAASHSGAYDDVPLAPNINVTDVYRPLVRSMLERSATFRRQWLRLARATDLTIDVRSEPGGNPLMAARTTIRRQPGQPMHASVVIARADRTAELIAHELEHVVEQLDGINLDQKADVRGSGVRHCSGGESDAFETTRAIATGLRVAEDVGERRR